MLVNKYLLSTYLILSTIFDFEDIPVNMVDKLCACFSFLLFFHAHFVIGHPQVTAEKCTGSKFSKNPWMAENVFILLLHLVDMKF